MGYNPVHPSDSKRTKRRKEEDRLCISCRVYTCICFGVTSIIYAVVGVTIYLMDDFGYKDVDGVDGVSDGSGY